MSKKKLRHSKKTTPPFPSFLELCQLAEHELSLIRKELPSPIRQALDRVSIHLELFPDPKWLKLGIEPDQLGLFEGVGTEDPSSFQIPRITLWLGNLWLAANADPEAYLEEVRITFLHELGHYLGFDEDQLADRNLD